MARTKKQVGGLTAQKRDAAQKQYDEAAKIPKSKPKKQRGYGQASDGRTRKAHGGKVMPQAKPN